MLFNSSASWRRLEGELILQGHDRLFFACRHDHHRLKSFNYRDAANLFHNELLVRLDIPDVYLEQKITLSGYVMAFGHFLYIHYFVDKGLDGIFLVKIKGYLDKGFYPEAKLFFID